MVRFADVSAGKAGTLWWLPFIAAILSLATAIPFAWDEKDFGTFIVATFFYLPVVALVCIALCVWAVIERKSVRGRSIALSLVVIVALTGATFWVVPRTKDEIRFLIWSRTHGDLLRGAIQDAIILDWESWGMAGMENDSYLVSNPADDLAKGGATAWLHSVGSNCEIVASKRMTRGIYIVTTYQCPLR